MFISSSTNCSFINIKGTSFLFSLLPWIKVFQLIKTFEGYAEDRVKELKSAAGNLEKEVSMVSLERK